MASQETTDYGSAPTGRPGPCAGVLSACPESESAISVAELQLYLSFAPLECSSENEFLGMGLGPS
jgi:hypothetical protein